MAKMTKAARREWGRLLSGQEADGDTLQGAGLIYFGTEIRTSGRLLTKVDTWDFTDAGRAALGEAENG